MPTTTFNQSQAAALPQASLVTRLRFCRTIRKLKTISNLELRDQFKILIELAEKMGTSRSKARFKAVEPSLLAIEKTETLSDDAAFLAYAARLVGTKLKSGSPKRSVEDALNNSARVERYNDIRNWTYRPAP